jgi:hypothetical protein
MNIESTMRNVRAPGALVIALSWAGPGLAATYTADLAFSTSVRQSAWGTGAAQRKSDSIFLGTTWNNRSASAGGVTGSVSTETVPNPAFAAWAACKGATLGLGDCGDEPPLTTTATIDNRTGAEASLTTSGKAGVQVDYTFDAGSVGASLGFVVSATAPVGVKSGEFFSLGQTGSLASGMLDAQSPTAAASVDIVFNLDAKGSGRVCAIPFGCTGGGGTFLNFDSSTEIVSIDPNKISFAAGLLPAGTSLEVPLGNVTASVNVASGIPPGIPPSVAVDVNGLTIGPPPSGVVVDVANAEITVPNVVSSGGVSGDRLTASGSDRILALKADVDAIAPFVPVGGAGFSLGPLGVTLDAFDVEAGPTMSLFQNFTLIPELMVDFIFDKPVFAEGIGLLSSWTGAWDALPEFAVTSATLFSPTFWLESQLQSQTGLQFGLELTVDLLKASLGIGPASFDIGPVVDFSLAFDPAFAQIDLFNDTFAFEGFGRFAAASFTVAPVPAPLPLLLLGTGLAVLGFGGRRRKARGRT